MNPAETADPTEMQFRLRTRVGPGNHLLDGGPDIPMRSGNFEGERSGPLQSVGILCRHLCKNSGTDADAVWDVGSDGPKESC